MKTLQYKNKDGTWINIVGGGEGGTYDDTQLKNWISNNYPKKEALEDYEKTTDLTQKLTNLKSEILGGAGEDYDTLKEIETWITEHQDIYQGLISTISNKANTDYVNSEVQTLLGEINKKAQVVVCDNQYEFDNILTKDNDTIYLIKGDQDVWAAKDYVDELFDMIVDLRSRITRLESDTPNEEKPSIE